MIGTDEFRALGVLESKARGMPDLRFAITRHPIGGLRPPAVLEKAAAMVEDTVAAVLSAEPAPAAALGGDG